MFTKRIFSALICAFMTSGALFLSSCEGKSANSSSCAAPSDTTQIVLNNIMTRTSIRQFTSRPIAKDTLLTIVKAGMAAPSAVNLQPWSFIVIDDRETLQKLNSVHPYANLKTATAAIVVCGLPDKTDNESIRAYWVQDCSAATENILLAAHAFGIGAVWCGVYPNPERIPSVKEVLEIPENVEPLNIITMGWPDQNPEPKDKWKEENVHFQKW